MRKVLWIVPLLFAVISAPIARADTFSFGVAEVGGGPISGSGTLTTAGLSDGTYQITGITGTFDGSAIVGLSTFDYADNLLYQNTLLPDVSGIAFQLANGDEFNLYDQTQDNLWGTPSYSSIPLAGDSFSVSDIAQMENNYAYTSVIVDPEPTPEPSSIALMLVGIGCLVMLRKRLATGLQQVA